MKKNRTYLVLLLAFALVFGDISFGIGNIVYAKEEVKAEENLKGDELEKNESEQEKNLVNELKEGLEAIAVLNEDEKLDKLEDYIINLEKSKENLKEDELNSLKDLTLEEIEKLENSDKKRELLKKLEELNKEEVESADNNFLNDLTLEVKDEDIILGIENILVDFDKAYKDLEVLKDKENLTEKEATEKLDIVKTQFGKLKTEITKLTVKENQEKYQGIYLEKGKKIENLLNILNEKLTNGGNTSENQLPKTPQAVKVTPSKFIPRIGEEIVIELDDFGYENMEDPFYGDYGVVVKNYEEKMSYDRNAFKLNRMEVPNIVVEKYKDGNWINYGTVLNVGFTGRSHDVTDSYIALPGGDNSFTLTRKEIEDILSETENETIGGVNEFKLYMDMLNEDGSDPGPKEDKYNRLTHNGPMKYVYDIVDDTNDKPYAILKSESHYVDEYPEVPYLYFETSDIKLELAEENRQFKPGETVKLKATIENKSKNIPNAYLYSGINFGEQEIVKNPVYTEGLPNAYLNYNNTDSSYIPVQVEPGKSIEFNTTITIPKEIPDNILDSNGKLVITPFLMTANMTYNPNTEKWSTGFHVEEREYNELILIDIEKQEHNVSFETNGGSSIESQKVKDKEKAKKPTNPTKDGYEFVGWYENKDLTGSEFDFNTEITGNITLYAKWEKESSGGNGGGHKPDKDKDKDKDKEVIRPQVENTIYHKAYIKGYEDNTVKPQGNLTREEAAMIIYRILDVESSNTKNYYSDIENTRWSKEAINYLSSKGIIEGYPDGKFRPEEKITRAEVTALITRLEKKTNKSENKFSDINNHWAKDYILISVANNWVVGYPEGDFRPNNNITRAEFVTMVNRMLGRKVDEDHILNDIKKFKDLDKSEWYYTDIVEASNSHNLKEKRLKDNFEEWTSVVNINI